MSNQDSTWRSDRINAFAAGLLYFLAAASSIATVPLYQPVLYNAGYLTEAAKHSNLIASGVISDLISVCAVAGTAIMLYPYLRRVNHSLSLAYLALRWFEAIAIMISAICVLSLLTLSRSIDPSAQAGLAITGKALKAFHDWAYIVGPNFLLGINTFIYSYLFFRFRLVPRKLSSMGMVAAVVIFLASLLEMFSVIQQVSIAGLLFALPIFTYETILAVWLMERGFNRPALAVIRTSSASSHSHNSNNKY